MSNILDRIKEYKLEEICSQKHIVSPQTMRDMAESHTRPLRGFVRRLKSQYDATQHPALIAEIKKASPSKGLIREDFQPSQLAASYEEGGAACLSILTDQPSFQGSPEFLELAGKSSSLPCLRKDFLYDTYQVFQARVWGADCILVIMASVTDAQAKDLAQTAEHLGLDCLCEVHDQAELDRAMALGMTFLGINNRDLKTFEVSLTTSQHLGEQIPSDIFWVSESGIFTAHDVTRVKNFGARAILVGESLMRQADIIKATKELMATT